ncbi:MAG: MaoC family dehydratase N-terminal domain-containing protein [Clostridia bacterium]|nr:MaoC family dehydratase N-terminal domain-containing protein [Clostridia bacterium]
MYLDDITVGTKLELPAVSVDREEMIDFSEKYDPFPLHVNEAYAKTTRFGDLIAPGLFSFLLVWKQFVKQGWIGEDLVAGKATKIEWHKPVFAGDVLFGTATVTDIVPRNPYNGLVCLSIDVRNQRGETVLTSLTEGVVRYRASEEN